MGKFLTRFLAIGFVSVFSWAFAGPILHAEDTNTSSSVSAPAEKTSSAPVQEAASLPPASAETQLPDPAPTPSPDLAETSSEFRPEVIISEVGSELSIKVTYAHPMDFAQDNAIDYIRMETLSGEFLGLTSFNAPSEKAAAEFMVNPKLANFDQVRLVAKSSKVGLIKSIHKLEVTAVPEPPQVVPVPAQQPSAASAQNSSAPKKKRWGIF